MQFILDAIRKIVVLVLLMELVIQMQPGKSYEPYVKMLVGVMIVYSIASGIGSLFTNITTFQMPLMKEFVWSDEGVMGVDIASDNERAHSDTDILVPKVDEIHVEQIAVEEIKVKVKSIGGKP